MRMHLLNWLRGVCAEGAVSRMGTVSRTDAVAPLVPEVVSGVSRLGSARVAGSLAAVGLGLWVTSCAEPKLDGLPEDPGEQLPLPTIGPPNASGIGDAGMLPSDDASADEETETNEVEPGNADAGEVTTDLPGTETNEASNGSTPATTSGASTSTAPASTSSSSTSTAHTESTSGTGAATTGTSSSENPDTTDTSDSTDSTDDTTGTDDTSDETDTSAIEADAGIDYPYDGGTSSDDSTDESSVEVDAGDAGDAGMDGGGEL